MKCYVKFVYVVSVIVLIVLIITDTVK